MNTNEAINRNEPRFIEVPLGGEAHRFAKEFSVGQNTSAKRKQVYLNTLAAYAVHRYCQCLRIETDLCRSGSWDPLMQRYSDATDLFISEIGRTVECCPVMPGTTVLQLPRELSDSTGAPPSIVMLQPMGEFPHHLERLKREFPVSLEMDTTKNCIDCIGVQFDEQLRYGTLLGFTTIVIPELVPVSVAPWSVHDQLARELGWSPPEALVLARHLSVQPFQAEIAAIRKKVLIPAHVRGSFKDIELDGTPLQLLAAAWQLPTATGAKAEPNPVQRWSLLLLLRKRTGGLLPPGLRLSVQTSDMMVSDDCLKEYAPYFSQCVEGNLDAQFSVILTLDGDEQDLGHPFHYLPDHS